MGYKIHKTKILKQPPWLRKVTISHNTHIVHVTAGASNTKAATLA